jgi:hypothetical protein
MAMIINRIVKIFLYIFLILLYYNTFIDKILPYFEHCN